MSGNATQRRQARRYRSRVNRVVCSFWIKQSRDDATVGAAFDNLYLTMRDLYAQCDSKEVDDSQGDGSGDN